jgi:D-glycero-D-manno-heptose 1,7-bisphosphate phosphatase
MSRRAIFFDRDGVLNHAIIKDGKPFAPVTLDELEIFHDASTVLQGLKDVGFLLIGVTNQPDVARGITPRETVEAINKKLMQELPLDDIRVCYHDDADKCHCRKPLPGLLIDAANEFGIDLTKSIMVGDRWKDIEAGHSAGCKTILLGGDYLEQAPNKPADFTVATLTEAADIITGIK